MTKWKNKEGRAAHSKKNLEVHQIFAVIAAQCTTIYNIEQPIYLALISTMPVTVKVSLYPRTQIILNSGVTLFSNDITEYMYAPKSLFVDLLLRTTLSIYIKIHI